MQQTQVCGGGDTASVPRERFAVAFLRCESLNSAPADSSKRSQQGENIWERKKSFKRGRVDSPWLSWNSLCLAVWRGKNTLFLMLSQLSIINQQLIWFSYSTSRRMFFSCCCPKEFILRSKCQGLSFVSCLKSVLICRSEWEVFCSEIRECSCIHTELKLTSVHAFCPNPGEDTHASVSSSLVILAAVGYKEVLGASLGSPLPLASAWLLEYWLFRGCSP